MKRKFIFVLIAIAFVLTIVGCGKDKEFELTFNTDGGIEISSVKVGVDSEYELPIPTRDGYSFAGWYLNSDFTGEAVTSIKLNGNVTIYAKWEQLIAINLDLDGGSCETTTIYGKVGDNVLNLVSNIVPTKSGVKFGAWFINETELTSSTKLTAKGLTLKAKYQVEYITNVYKQNTTLDGYDKEEVKAYAYVGKKVTANTDYDGFTLVDKDDSISEITVNADKTKNVMNVYFDRDTYTITFRSNYPVEGLTPVNNTVQIIYGVDTFVPQYDLSCEGYYLLGWAASVDGEIIYDAHYIDNRAYNLSEEDKTEVVMDKLTAERNMSLYAIWNKGCRDMFGGNDYIFKTKDSDTLYLCRGGIYFVGEYDKSDSSFIFYNDYENIVGRIFEDDTFAFANVARSEYSATLYEVGKGLNNDVKILFDAYNGINYTEVDSESTVNESKGTYVIDENGYYVATFTSGPQEGKTLTMVIGTVTLDNVKTDAFQLRNEEEYALGQLVRFGVNNNQISYYTSAYDVVLTGFGTLIYNTGNGKTTYYYTLDKSTQMLDIKNSNGQSVGVGRIVEFNGKKGYMLYNASLDVTFNGEDGSTLALDGYSTATYVKGDTVVSGYYNVKSSAFGGSIITFVSNNVTYTFLTKSHTEETVTPGENGEDKIEKITVYTFEVKPNGYAEYYYKDASGTYYAPLVVINDKEEGKANVYGYTKNKTYELVLEGTYTYDENTKLYAFVATSSDDTVEVINNPIEISKVTSFIFNIDTTTTSYAINYWYQSVIGDETKTYDVKYTSDNATMTVIAGLAIYSRDGYVITGTISTKNGLSTISSNNGNVYLEIDEEAKTFITLDHAPYNAYYVKDDGTYSNKEYVSLDGKGNGTYVYYVKEMVGEGEEAKEEDVKKEINGTITKLDETTKQGNQIYKFTSADKTFKFILVNTQSNSFCFPFNETVNGDYTSEDGVLYLDGFTYYASFVDKDGNEFKGIYSYKEDMVRILGADGSMKYFDLKAEKKFTVKGEEYGTYVLFDNQGAPGYFIDLDGYGKASIFKTEKDGEGNSQRVDIDTNGSYTIDGERYTINFKENTQDVTWIGFLSTYTYQDSTYRTFAIEHEEVVKTFLNTKDWSILKLDAIGNATKYNNNGVMEKGTYKIVSDAILYYVNEAGTDANIYKYNFEKGTIVESEFNARGYYTTDLKSLLFSQYGFAIFNNETRYYYCMSGNDVLIYHQDPENPQANKYGFVEENFGEFDDVKVFNGLTYYSNDGYAITFTRVEESKDKYPVLVTSNPETHAPLEDLTFTPSGSDTFNVLGSVKIYGSSYNCRVIRELVDEHYEMYVTVGYYRFDIEATYTGKDANGNTNSTYSITGMKFVRSFYSYTYLNTYYYIYSFLGANYASGYTNNLGMFYVERTYDEEGKQLTDTCTLDLFEGSKAYDLNGEILKAENVNYQSGSYYVVEFVAGDGYTYKAYLQLQNHTAFNLYGYRIIAITRAETLTDGDFELTFERIIVTEMNYNIGGLFSAKLKKGEEEIDYSEIYQIDNVYHYVVKEYDDNKVITKTTYYKLELVEKEGSSVGEDENVVKAYESVTITEIEGITYTTADGKTFVDVLNGRITLVQIDGNRYAVKESSYDDETKQYTISLSSGKEYTVTIDDSGVPTITEVVQTEETA